MASEASTAALRLDDIERRLLDRADSASVEELGTIASALKSVAEARFTELNAHNKGRETWLEMFKSIAAILVPLVSLLALAGTVVYQNKQIEATRQQTEDTEWRDLLASLKGVSDTVYSDPTVAPRLRSFFTSQVYGDQAKSIAGRLMGHISNPDGFRDLYSAVFGDVTDGNAGSVADIGRALMTSEAALHGQCNDLMNGAKIPFDRDMLDCGVYVDDARATELSARLNVPAQVATMRRSVLQLDREQAFVVTKLTEYLRENYRLPRDHRRNPGLDLSGLGIVLRDFSDLDLTDFTINGTLFDTVDFRGTVLNTKARVEGRPGSSDVPDFRGSTWWEAKSIEPDLLVFLIQWYYPYLRADTRYPVGYRITQDAYLAKARALCAAAAITCPSPMKFGPQQP
jgi:hypothetical protein